jgi:4-hydroxybenzoate polyprenyltransferase
MVMGLRPSHANNTVNTLVVDLDGTLIRTDILLESILALLKRNPLWLLCIPFWLIRGKAYLKSQIAQRADIDEGSLPYNKMLLRHLHMRRHQGATLIMATASHQKYAQAIARHLGIFSAIIASDDQRNLSGDTKLRAIRQHLGDTPFCYAGNAPVDLAVWQGADSAIVVNLPERWLRYLPPTCKVEAIFRDGSNRLKHIFKAMRVYQWLKNLLVFVPILTAQMTNITSASHALLGFLAFSFCASSVYLLNDLMDLSADRQHRTKRRRPFASGRLGIEYGLLLIPFLLVIAAGFAMLLPSRFLAALVLYYATTLFYTFHLKNLMMLDVLTLAGLYTLRIIAGAAAIEVDPSFWLLAFSMFIFLSLAMIKRCSELFELGNSSRKQIAGRQYIHLDYHNMSSLGCAAGFIAVLVMALYINSNIVIELYSHPKLLWLLCPLLLYWQGRLWLATGRGRMHDDPIVFTLRDQASWLVGALALTAVWLAV